MNTISRRNFLRGSAALGAAAAASTMGLSVAASAEEKAYNFAQTVKWDAEYDVVVLGMGFAGMTAAMTAADAGAKVLLAEKMSEALAGGNSKVAGQLFAYGHEDKEATAKYYKALAGGRQVPDDMLDVIVTGVTSMWKTLADKLFDGDDSEFFDWTGVAPISEMSPEYPEFLGSDKVALCTTHKGCSDSFLYAKTKEAAYKRADKIDFWFESPATELIQDPDTKTIVGVKITRGGATLNVRALNGVVVATGGFECDTEMCQNYLNLTNYTVIGGQYNTGDGVKMCQKAGAKLWHMDVYEGGFSNNSCGYYNENGAMAARITNLVHTSINSGAMVIVGTEGERFGDESYVPRHGHMPENGLWENPNYPNVIYQIFDQTQYDTIVADKTIAEDQIAKLVSADTIEELAAAIGLPADKLAETIADFNSFAEGGKDYKCSRPAQYMRAFDGKKYYALRLAGLVLNTQGGPQRNPKGEILDIDSNPIPHLYSAGEMGGITSCMYQGGTNIAECFIFGEIAGKNAAESKADLAAYTARDQVESTPTKQGEVTDHAAEAVAFEAGENQAVATAAGMMGDVTVRVTVADGKISTVEVLDQNETPELGGVAANELPGKFVGCASAEEIDTVDAVTGATVTSNALKTAVKDALAKLL